MEEGPTSEPSGRRGLAVGSALGFAALVVALAAAGSGHGSDVPAKLLFPYTMLSTLVSGVITIPSMVLTLVQFPLYGALVGRVRSDHRRAVVTVLIAVHAMTALCALVALRGGGFDP